MSNDEDSSQSEYKNRFSFKVIRYFIFLGIEVLDFMNNQCSEEVEDEDYLMSLEEVFVFMHAYTKNVVLPTLGNMDYD